MIRLAVLVTLCGALVACDNVRKDQIAFDGQYFRSKAAKIDKGDRRPFTVEVRPASASLPGALAAGRHEAIKYCVDTFGNSTMTWRVGPDNDPASYVLQGDTLVLEGVCEG